MEKPEQIFIYDMDKEVSATLTKNPEPSFTYVLETTHGETIKSVSVIETKGGITMAFALSSIGTASFHIDNDRLKIIPKL